MSNHLYTILPSPSDHPSMPHCLYDNSTSLSDCPSLSDCLSNTTTHLCAHPSSNMTQCLHDSSKSLAVVNGEQSHKAKKFCRAFTNYDLLLHALDVYSIYTSVSRHVLHLNQGRMLMLHVECVISVDLP